MFWVGFSLLVFFFFLVGGGKGREGKGRERKGKGKKVEGWMDRKKGGVRGLGGFKDFGERA